MVRPITASMKKSIYFRYEFSDESGQPEGGDIFRFDSVGEVQAMVRKVIEVAQGDQVAVHITLGGEVPFFGMMQSGGLSQRDLEAEMADQASAKKKTAKKKAAKKKARK